MPVPRVYIGLGSNLGRRTRNIRKGLQLLASAGIRIEKTSGLYETEPVDMPGARCFLNCAAQASTELSPEACLVRCRRIERRLGRGRHARNQPRTLDLDLLFYDRTCVHRPGLTIPHPRLHRRAFVLTPLAEIAPGLVHPVLRRRVRTLLAGCDRKGVRPWKAR